MLTWAGLGVVLVGIILWGSASARRAAEEEASLLSLMGGYALEQQDLHQARTYLLQAAEAYGKVPSAGRATFMLGQVFFRLGAIATSQVYYQRYLDRFGEVTLLKAAAQAGIASCQEEQGAFVAAAEGFERAARTLDSHSGAASYLLQAARCYRLASNIPEAMTIYELVKLEYPESAEADRAGIEAAQLELEGGLNIP